MKQRVDYFEHEADIGIIGRGATIENAFEAAAESVFGIMTQLPLIKPQKSIHVEFEESNPEFALVEWINLLIATARIKGLILGKFALHHAGSHWAGEAWGEPWRDDLIRGTEVKGATLTMLSVKSYAGRWEARCVVDV